MIKFKEIREPRIAAVLSLVEKEAIVVGSAAFGLCAQRKDIDIVVSYKGLKLITSKYRYFMPYSSKGCYIVHCKEKIIDVFYLKTLDCLCPIKNKNRILFSEVDIAKLPLIGVYGPQLPAYRV